MSQSVVKFLTTLKVHFPPRLPRPELEEAWVQSMIKVLRGYSATVLEKAAQDIINTRKRTDFPRPAECKAACDEVIKWENMAKRTSALPIGGASQFQSPDYSPERVRLADDLVRTDQGRRAAREGWLLSLHDYCRKHGQAPAANVEPALKRSAKEFDEAYQQCLRGGWVLSSDLVSLGDKMLARRQELTEMVLHGVERG